MVAHFLFLHDLLVKDAQVWVEEMFRSLKPNRFKQDNPGHSFFTLRPYCLSLLHNTNFYTSLFLPPSPFIHVYLVLLCLSKHTPGKDLWCLGSARSFFNLTPFQLQRSNKVWALLCLSFVCKSKANLHHNWFKRMNCCCLRLMLCAAMSLAELVRVQLNWWENFLCLSLVMRLFFFSQQVLHGFRSKADSQSAKPVSGGGPWQQLKQLNLITANKIYKVGLEIPGENAKKKKKI